MTSHTRPLLIIGGNSMIAKHVLALCPAAQAIARNGGGKVRAVHDYSTLDPAVFDGIGTVLNCAGLVHGSRDDLLKVNSDLQFALAEKARSAGVARFVGIGSFSIFGESQRISQVTEPAPVSDYGISKLEGEMRLAQLNGKDFEIANVVFPAIVGTNERGKVGQMLDIWRRVRIWPMPRNDVARSMIGAHGAARVLLEVARGNETGRLLAADPEVFSYRKAAHWLSKDLGQKHFVATLPRFLNSLMEHAAPKMHRSLLTDSLLQPSDNFMQKHDISSSLRVELVALAKR